MNWPRITVQHSHHHTHIHRIDEASMSAVSDAIRAAVKTIGDLRAENAQLKTQLATANETNAHLQTLVNEEGATPQDLIDLNNAVAGPPPAPPAPPEPAAAEPAKS